MSDFMIKFIVFIIGINYLMDAKKSRVSIALNRVALVRVIGSPVLHYIER